MKKGFSIICDECKQEVVMNHDFLKEEDESNINISILGNYPFQSLYLVCSNCKNDLEIN